MMAAHTVDIGSHHQPCVAFDPLRCGVCARVKKAPRLLGCLHSVCLACLPTLVSKAGKTFPCPTCDVQTSIAVVVPTPTPDFLIARYADVHAMSTQKHICDSVLHETEEEAYAMCLECKYNYCAACTAAHPKRTKFATHTLMPFKKLDPTMLMTADATTALMCSAHPTERISAFCVDGACQCAVCPMCTTLTHQTHASQPLKEAHPDIKARLLALVKQVDGNRAQVAATIDAIAAEITAGDASLVQGLARLDALLTSLVKTVEEAKEEAQAGWAPCRMALVEQRADAEECMKVMDNATSYTQALIATVGAEELARAAPLVAGQLTAIRDGTQDMAPCVQAPAGGTMMVQVNEAAVAKAVKDRVVIVQGAIKGWKRDILGQTTVRESSIPKRPRARYIYVLGGIVGEMTQNTIERFDMQTRQWEARAPMFYCCAKLAAVVLKNRLYAIGGTSTSRHYDPKRIVHRYSEGVNAWEAYATVPRDRETFAAVVVDDKIYVLSGRVLDCFDPDTAAWECLPPPSAIHNAHTPLVAHEQFLFALGGTIVEQQSAGLTGRSSTDVVEQYNIARRCWELRAPMPKSRTGFAAAVLRADIYVVGGINESVVFRYDTTRDVWDATACAPMPTPRADLAVCAVNDERILVFGGRDGTTTHASGRITTTLANALATVMEYNPDTNSWWTCPSMPTARSGAAAACM